MEAGLAHRVSRRACGAVVAVALALGLPADAPAQAATLAARTRALELAYSLDHGEAIALMQRTVAEHPDDPSAHRTLASMALVDVLFQRGTSTVDFALGSVTKQQLDLPKPSPALASLFTTNIERAKQLCHRRLAANPKDVEALYELGAAHGMLVTYMAAVEGKVFAAFKAARVAFDTHERVLALAPGRRDARLIVGTYRYAVGNLSMPVRWVAYLAGFGGDAKRGITMIEEAAAPGSDAQVEAQIALMIIYSRETRHDDALRVIRDMQRRFPRNRLMWLEAGSSALRAGRPAEAERYLAAGLAMLARDTRPRMPGEESLWRYKSGAALVGLGRRDEARAQLDQAMGLAVQNWVRGRVRLERGKLADLEGRRPEAVAEYAEAARLCEGNNDPIGAAEARRLKATPYRGRPAPGKDTSK